MAKKTRASTTEGASRLAFNLPAIAERLRLAANPYRLTVLLALAGREHYVGELCDLLGEGPPSVSRLLQYLRVGGLVEGRRAGQNTYYGLTPEGRAVLEDVRFLAKAASRREDVTSPAI